MYHIGIKVKMVEGL